MAAYERVPGRWTVRVDLPRGPDGKRRYSSKGGFPTRREALAYEVRLKAALLDGSPVGSGHTTVESFAARWLEWVEHRVEASTLGGYRVKVANQIVPHLGHLRLTGVTGAHLAAWHGTLLSSGLSRRTVEYAHATLRVMLRDAVEWGLVGGNVASRVSPPRPRGQRRIVPWSPEELATFLENTRQIESSWLWRVAALTGMRRSELAGLRWTAVDLSTGTLTIDVARVAVGARVVTKGTKTHRTRVVAIDEETTAGLAEMRRARPWDEWVFVDSLGRPLHPDRISKLFRILVAEAGLRPIRFHDLRHTHPSQLLADGVDLKVISARLGHSSLAVTADIYAHVGSATDRDVAERAAALVRRKR
jgi:integrase